MNTRQFIAKQRVKYLWKTLRQSDRVTGSQQAAAQDTSIEFELLPY